MRINLFLATMLCGLFLLSPKTNAETMTFEAGCQQTKSLTIAAVGDLLFHKRLQYQAYRPNSNFKRFFSPLAGFLKSADLLYGNLEGPAAHGVVAGGRAVRDSGKKVYGRIYNAVLKSLSFNFHPSVIDDLKAVGFDVISTANNHAMDRGALGVDRTIENFQKRRLSFTGTRVRDKSAAGRSWSAITRANGFNVAWLACTFSVNGLPDRKNQILFCYQEKELVLREIAELARNPAIDAVILTPHWGIEGNHRPAKRQRVFAREAVEAGATAVIGTHPHVIQPWEKYVTSDGRESFIAYSTGNFISNQRKLMQRAGIIVTLELRKPTFSEIESSNIYMPRKAKIAAVGFIPTWVIIDGRGHRVSLNNGRGWQKQALARTLRLLPTGNRVGLEWPPKLKRSCTSTAGVTR